MPTYDRRCPAGHLIDVFVPIADRDLPVPCPVCGDPTARLIGAPAIGHIGGVPYRGSVQRHPSGVAYDHATNTCDIMPLGRDLDRGRLDRPSDL